MDAKTQDTAGEGVEKVGTWDSHISRMWLCGCNPFTNGHPATVGSCSTCGFIRPKSPVIRQETRTEYVVLSPGGSEYRLPTPAQCRHLAAGFDADRSDGKRCRVMERIITETDITEVPTDGR